MCGIIGGFFREPNNDLNEKFNISISKLKHRGPDDDGLEKIKLETGIIFLGQTRLSILDLSVAGHQPMHGINGKYTVVFNGEIYNYKELRDELIENYYTFSTDTDTEVLIAAWDNWKQECMYKFKGMFAFVIFDHETCEVNIVRDAFGIKPLYYFCDKDMLVFSSELPALLNLIPNLIQLNPQTCIDYLVMNIFDHSSNSFIAGVHQVLPSHFITLNLNDLELPHEINQKKWWYPSILEKSHLSFEDAASKLRTLLIENIRIHMRSDVPIGAALSGGLDSSAIVCLMRHIYPEAQINTFTYVADDDKFNEEKWADIINTYVKAVSNKIHFSSDNLFEDLNKVCYSQGEPFGGISTYAGIEVYKSVRDSGIIVALDGQGADEIFAGYDGYPSFYIWSLFEKKKYLEIFTFIFSWIKFPNRSFKNLLFILASMLIPKFIRIFIKRMFLYKLLPSWLDYNYFIKKDVDFFEKYFLPSKEGKGRRLMERLRFELVSGPMQSLLRTMDRNAMSSSCENRVPFLTIDLVEFVLSLPEEFLISKAGDTKYLLRQAMKGIVPEDILNRKDKVGFAPPERELLRSNIGKIKDIVKQSNIDFLDSKKLIDYIETDEFDESVVWRVLNFIKWHSLFIKEI